MLETLDRLTIRQLNLHIIIIDAVLTESPPQQSAGSSTESATISGVPTNTKFAPWERFPTEKPSDDEIMTTIPTISDAEQISTTTVPSAGYTTEPTTTQATLNGELGDLSTSRADISPVVVTASEQREVIPSGQYSISSLTKPPAINQLIGLPNAIATSPDITPVAAIDSTPQPIVVEMLLNTVKPDSETTTSAPSVMSANPSITVATSTPTTTAATTAKPPVTPARISTPQPTSTTPAPAMTPFKSFLKKADEFIVGNLQSIKKLLA